jgi:NADH-ubiquinone oxidoreductase chain 1
LFPVFIIFFIGALAETNRAPMDLAEAESELVSGFFTEHSATIFVLFFLAEYGSIVLISSLCSVLFLGGYLLPFHSLIMNHIDNIALEGLISGVTLGVKTCLLVFTFIWVRASFPRIRYDTLMTFCWTVLLPLVFAFIFLVPCILVAFDAVPTNISLL